MQPRQIEVAVEDGRKLEIALFEGRARRNRPDPIPALVLGRLAIHKEYHQKGIGTAVLREAVQRFRGPYKPLKSPA